MSTLSGIIDAHAGGLLPSRFTLLSVIYLLFCFSSVCAPFLPILSLITLLPSSFCLQDGVIIYRPRHSSFPAASQPLGDLFLIFSLKSKPFSSFSSPNGVWHEAAARLCQKWDQSDECGSETVSDFLMAGLDPNVAAPTHDGGWGGLMGKGWQRRLKWRETGEQKHKDD